MVTAWTMRGSVRAAIGGPFHAIHRRRIYGRRAFLDARRASRTAPHAPTNVDEAILIAPRRLNGRAQRQADTRRKHGAATTCAPWRLRATTADANHVLRGRRLRPAPSVPGGKQRGDGFPAPRRRREPPPRTASEASSSAAVPFPVPVRRRVTTLARVVFSRRRREGSPRVRVSERPVIDARATPLARRRVPRVVVAGDGRRAPPGRDTVSRAYERRGSPRVRALAGVGFERRAVGGVDVSAGTRRRRRWSCANTARGAGGNVELLSRASGSNRSLCDAADGWARRAHGCPTRPAARHARGEAHLSDADGAESTYKRRGPDASSIPSLDECHGTKSEGRASIARLNADAEMSSSLCIFTRSVRSGCRRARASRSRARARRPRSSRGRA